MGLLLPLAPLTPRHRLAVGVDPYSSVVSAQDIALYLEAQSTVEWAQAEAEAIVAEAESWREAERQRGYEEGIELARLAGAELMAEQVARTDGYFAGAEEHLTAVVVQAVRKIIVGFDDRERALQAVRNGLALVRNQRQITLRVHPDQAEYLRSRAAQLLADYPGVQLLDVVADHHVAADACVLESDIGVVEASTEGQLAALEAAFHRVRTAPL